MNSAPIKKCGGEEGTLDRIFESFLNHQHMEGMALAQSSDLLDLHQLGGPPAQRYVASFGCQGLIRTEQGEIVLADRFEVGIYFHPGYTEHTHTAHVLTWLGPRNVWHPNISDKAPFICIGDVEPGTPLVELIYRIFDVVSYHNVVMTESKALNEAACVWARSHQEMFPTDPRPLKRRTGTIRASRVTQAASEERSSR